MAKLGVVVPRLRQEQLMQTLIVHLLKNNFPKPTLSITSHETYIEGQGKLNSFLLPVSGCLSFRGCVVEIVLYGLLNQASSRVVTALWCSRIPS